LEDPHLQATNHSGLINSKVRSVALDRFQDPASQDVKSELKVEVDFDFLQLASSKLRLLTTHNTHAKADPHPTRNTASPCATSDESSKQLTPTRHATRASKTPRSLDDTELLHQLGMDRCIARHFLKMLCWVMVSNKLSLTSNQLSTQIQFNTSPPRPITHGDLERELVSLFAGKVARTTTDGKR
jgi:hypothetical protein